MVAPVQMTQSEIIVGMRVGEGRAEVGEEGFEVTIGVVHSGLA